MADEAEVALHEAVLDGIDKRCERGAVWRRPGASSG
jgi:hypothetical protein